MVQVGDTVRVVDKAKMEDHGWEDVWLSEMDKTIGKVGKIVKDTGKFGLHVKFRHLESFNYPSHVLRKVGQGRWSICEVK